MIETIPELLRGAARKWGDKPALKSMSEAPASFNALDRQADRFAKSLIADGMQPGERIAIWAPNMWEWAAAAAGAQRACGVLVPLNVRLRGAEVGDILRRARVTRLVSIGDYRDADFPRMLAGEDLPCLRRIIVLRASAEPAGKNAMTWDRFLEMGDGLNEALLSQREAGLTGESVSDIIFTSGTTGKPKGAVFHHRSSVLSAYGMINFARVADTDCQCPLGPFSHFAGYKAGWVNGLLTGATVCWIDAHDAESVLDAIATLRISVMPAPPVVWQDVLDHPNRRDWDISSLRFIATGSTTIPPALVRGLIAELGVEQVGTGYGLTESGGMTNFSRPDDAVENVVHTAGRSAPDAETCIAGPDGTRLGANQPGEILVRTERAMREYLDDPEATRAALTDGWLHTGDVGTIDEEGYLRVTDRLKDMYITNGFNVYPAELERLMSAIPGVAHCALVGVPDPRKGEVGHAFVVRSPGSGVTSAEIVAWCRNNIAAYKIPAGISFLVELPRNAQGKVLKNDLRLSL